MDEQRSILKRYYRGETTLREEQELKKKFNAGELQEHPFLALKARRQECPAFVRENIRTAIYKRQKRARRHWIITAGSIAAIVILMISLRGTLYPPSAASIQLSNNTKKERFEDAMYVIGNVIKSKPATNEKILYEDSRIIISIE